MIIGPFIDGYTIPSGTTTAMASNAIPYALINGVADPVPVLGPSPDYIDVRDAARAHVLALRAPRGPSNERKRLPLSGGPLPWAEAGPYLREVRPALSERLPPSGKLLPPGTAPPAGMDSSRALKVLQITELTDWKLALIETVDDLLRVEASWAAASSMEST